MSRISKFFTVQPTTSKCTGSIIFLHGSGDTGSSFYSWWCNELGRKLQFENVRLHFPSAAPMFYTPAQSQFNVWMNRMAIDISSPEHDQSTNEAVQSVSELIDREVQAGIPLNKILIGGFSMGGAVALHVGYRSRRGLAGVFALSSFLNRESAVYKALDTLSGDEVRLLPPLYQTHGDADTLVLPSWGAETYEQLKKRGVAAEFLNVPRCSHELHKDALEQVLSWAYGKLA